MDARLIPYHAVITTERSLEMRMEWSLGVRQNADWAVIKLYCPISSLSYEGLTQSRVLSQVEWVWL